MDEYIMVDGVALPCPFCDRGTVFAYDDPETEELITKCDNEECPSNNDETSAS